MPLVLSLILWLAFAGAVAGAVHLWRRQLEAGRREDLQALAARRGWSLTISGGKLGRAGSLRIAPRGGHPWVAQVNGGTRRGAARTTGFEAQEPRWAEATMLVAPVASGAGAPFATPLPPLDGEVARRAADLQPVPSPEGLLVRSDGAPSQRVDLTDLDRVLSAWVPIASGERGVPIVTLSPDGLRVGLRHAVTRADHLERFVDLSLELSRIIGP